MAFDIPLVKINAVDNGHADQLKQFTLQTGLLSSALEHAVPEQLFVNAQNPGEAISAVKALQKTNAQGQRIYHITQANQSAILPNIHHDHDTMDEIQNALNAGKEVITHTDAVSVPDWSGAGYIITDPVTGDGAYKISGGANGGFYEDLIFGLSMLFAIIGGAIDGYVGSAGNDIPISEDLKKALFANKLEPLGKWLGGVTLLWDITTTLFDKNLDVTNKVGRISVALLGYFLGSYVGALIGAAFLPGGAIVAAIVVAAFAFTLAIVLQDFMEIYFSLRFERSRRQLMTFQA